MDQRVYEAAIAGSVTLLLELIEEDPLVLDRTLVVCDPDTPLHIAAILGHIDFAREILRRKPELASALNWQGFSPLHLAAAKGYIEIVKDILRVDSSSDVYAIRDRNGRTPVHSAAIKGRLGVLKELIQARPEAILTRTDQGETILHLSTKNNHFDLVKWMVEWEDNVDFMNMKDDDGNTALHFSAALKNIQIMNLLLSKSGVDVNAINTYGFTALDVLLHNSSELGLITDMSKMLEDAGAIRVRNVSMVKNQMNREQSHPSPQTKFSNRSKLVETQQYQQDKRWKLLMVVAISIVTVTFDVGLNPPDSKCQKDNGRQCDEHNEFWQGVAIATLVAKYSTRFEINHNIFMFIDIVGFLASLSVVILLLSMPPLKPAVLEAVLMTFMWISVTSIALTFSILTVAIYPSKPFAALVPLVWLGLLYLWQIIRFAQWFLNKFGFAKKRERSPVTDHSPTDVEMAIRDQR